MHLGNRRFYGAIVLAVGLAAALSGCSGTVATATLGSTNGEAVAIGQEAIGFTSSGGSSAGWASPIACPAGFEDGLRSSTPTADTLLKVDPTTVTGPVSDPQLTTGYVATCVYRVTTPSNSILELAFFDIDDVHSAAIAAQLVSDGFVSQGTTTHNDAEGHTVTQTIYASAVARVVIASLTINSTPALVIAG